METDRPSWAGIIGFIYCARAYQVNRILSSYPWRQGCPSEEVDALSGPWRIVRSAAKEQRVRRMLGVIGLVVSVNRQEAHARGKLYIPTQ